MEPFLYIKFSKIEKERYVDIELLTVIIFNHLLLILQNSIKLVIKNPSLFD